MSRSIIAIEAAPSRLACSFTGMLSRVAFE
jgi:hypothetical protein